MNEHPSASTFGKGPALPSDDSFALFMLAVTFSPVLLGILSGTVPQVRLWLVDYQVLVPPAAAVWALPGMEGAGLDTLRIVLAGLMLLVIILGGYLRRARRIRRSYRG